MENKICATCIDNDNGFCDRKGVMIKDENFCEKWKTKQNRWKEKSMIKKLLFWLIKAKTVNCMHCCLWCEYWEQCQEEYNMLKLGLQKKTMINEKNQRRSEDE